MVLFAVILMVFLPCFARAGQYHTGNSLVCQDCHNMHYSGTHDYSGGGPISLGAGGPHTYLLKDSLANICLSCHDGGDESGDNAPDVKGAHLGVHYRQAGALPTGVAPYENTKGHELGSTATAPGGTWNNANGLACMDCHDPHGTSNYRNLLFRPGGVVSDRLVSEVTGGVNDLTKDVWENAITPTATQYAYTNINFNEPDTTASRYANWCQSCHTNFHGAAETGDPEPWSRHPTANVNITAGTKTDPVNWSGLALRVKVMAADGIWDNANDETPSCMTCHKSHGSTRKFGLIWDDGSGDGNPENGTGILKTCQQCHNK